MSNKTITVGDVFVSVENHPIFDSPEAIEQLSVMREQLKLAPPGSQCLAIFDEDADGDLEIRPFVVPPESRLALDVVEAYKKTPAFKVLMEHLDDAVTYFPDKERTVTALASLVSASYLNRDFEVTAFGAQCICTLLQNVTIIGLFSEIHESEESVRNRHVIQIGFLHTDV